MFHQLGDSGKQASTSRTEERLFHATYFIFTISVRVIMGETLLSLTPLVPNLFSCTDPGKWISVTKNVFMTITLMVKRIMHCFQESPLIFHTWTGDCSIQRSAVSFLKWEHCKQLMQTNFDNALIGHMASIISLMISKRGAKSLLSSSLKTFQL